MYTYSYQQDLSDVVNNVCGWWGGCEAMKVWMDEAEKMLSAHTPLASSVDIVQEQKRSIEVGRYLLNMQVHVYVHI